METQSCLKNPHGQGSLVGYSSWSHTESDTAEQLSTAQHEHVRGNGEKATAAIHGVQCGVLGRVWTVTLDLPTNFLKPLFPNESIPPPPHTHLGLPEQVTTKHLVNRRSYTLGLLGLG